MRKKVNVIVILLLAVCLLTLVACQTRDEDGLRKIKAPQNLALSGSALSWDEVERAERYIIYVGDEEKAETTSTTYDISALVSGYGDFNITVRACGDGVKYGKSDKSAVIVYHKGNSLDVPVVTVDKAAKTAKWQSVPNAVKYSIFVYNGKDEALIKNLEVSETSFSFADKTDEEGKDIFEGYDKYRITVTAKPEDGSREYSDSSLASAFYINSTTLSAPQFSSLNSSRIQWNSVTNAKSYELKLMYHKASDGSTVEKKKITTTGTSYQRSNFTYDEVGDYYYSIKAIGDGEIYLDSDWSEENDNYKVTKLAGVEENDIVLKYDNDGKARLTWSIDVNTSANQFYLSLKGLLPDGTSKLENSDSSMTISSKVVFVKGKVFDVYKYVDKSTSYTVEKVDGEEILVYNNDGQLMVRYNGVDSNVKNNLGDDLSYASFVRSEGVDIVYDTEAGVFEYRYKAQIADGSNANQERDEEERNIIGSNGNQLYYFEEDSSDEKVEKSVSFDDDHNPVSLDFAINLDDIFIEKVEEEIESEDGGDPTVKTTYKYNIKDSSYYGILYNISVSAGNSSNNYVVSSDAVTPGRYLSYKIPSKNGDGEYEINDAGEYAYIILKNYIDSKNGVSDANKYRIVKNINFKGYEVAQIQTLKDSIDGDKHTLSNMVVGNSQLTEDGVIRIDDGNNKVYSLYYNISNDAEITDAFYMGINFVGYEKKDVENDVENIFVAPIAYNNNGELRRVFVQSDSIKADSAYLSGMVINNNGDISSSQVYAELSGRIVAGIAINNNAMVRESGFYGSITASVGEFIESDLSEISGAGLVVNNNASAFVINSEAIGSVDVEAVNLSAGYAGGLVAINKGSIDKSYSGEYTRADVSGRKEVVANGNNSYAGGLVGLNDESGTITDSYSTNRASARYVGGFVGLNKGSIERTYALGGTDGRGQNVIPNNGAFAGVNEGTIQNVSAYSKDEWVRDEEYFDIIKDESQLSKILDALYSDGAKQMDVTGKDGFRYPILVSRIYTKNYVVEMSPLQIPDVKGIFIAGDEVKEVSIEESDICGDRSSRDNKVVIVINYNDSYTKLVYGKIK